jgi:hypothetical protein
MGSGVTYSYGSAAVVVKGVRIRTCSSCQRHAPSFRQCNFIIRCHQPNEAEIAPGEVDPIGSLTCWSNGCDAPPACDGLRCSRFHRRRWLCRHLRSEAPESDAAPTLQSAVISKRLTSGQALITCMHQAWCSGGGRHWFPFGYWCRAFLAAVSPGGHW